MTASARRSFGADFPMCRRIFAVLGVLFPSEGKNIGKIEAENLFFY